MAQLVAHLLCKQRVAGSNPASSTPKALKQDTYYLINNRKNNNIKKNLIFSQLCLS